MNDLLYLFDYKTIILIVILITMLIYRGKIRSAGALFVGRIHSKWKPFSVQAKYFLLAIVGLGTMGIWYPLVWEWILKDDVTVSNMPQNMLTYFVSLLLCGSIEYGLRLFDNEVKLPKSEFLNVIGWLLFALAFSTFAVILDIKGEIVWAFTLPIVGIVTAWILWWYINADSDLFKANATLGGDAEKPLSNG